MSCCDADRQPLEVDEEDVLLGRVGEALRQRDREQALAQAHRRVAEDRRVHQARRAVDHRPEVHLREDVALDVDAGRDLDEFEPVLAQPEHAALGDVERRLPALPRLRAGVGAVLDLVHELARVALLEDRELAVARVDARGARR